MKGNCSTQRDFSWVVTDAISAIKNMLCFDVAAVLGKEEKYLAPPSFSPQSRRVCDQNALKCVSPWGKQQRNRKLNYKILMKLQILLILRKQWKVQRVSRYYTMHCGSLCAAHGALEELGCFVPGLWGGQTQQSCFMFPETTSGKSGEKSAGKARGLPRYSPEPHSMDSAGIGETCRNMCQLDFHKTGLAGDQICVQQWRDTWFQSPVSSLCSWM